MTISTSRVALTSASGLARSTTRSATRPAATLPRESGARRYRAGSSVAVRSAWSGVSPASWSRISSPCSEYPGTAYSGVSVPASRPTPAPESPRTSRRFSARVRIARARGGGSIVHHKDAGKLMQEQRLIPRYSIRRAGRHHHLGKGQRGGDPEVRRRHPAEETVGGRAIVAGQDGIVEVRRGTAQQMQLEEDPLEKGGSRLPGPP